MKIEEYRKMMRTNCHAKPRHIESQIQIQMVDWFKVEYPQYIISHTPNGGYRNSREAAIFKREGVLAGFPDLTIIANSAVLFVEVKTKTGRQSELQKDFQTKVERLGFPYVICRSLQEFALTVSKWLKEDEKK